MSLSRYDVAFYILLIFWGNIVNVLFLFQTININNNHIINDTQVSVCGALVNWKLSRIEKTSLSFLRHTKDLLLCITHKSFKVDCDNGCCEKNKPSTLEKLRHTVDLRVTFICHLIYYFFSIFKKKLITLILIWCWRGGEVKTFLCYQYMLKYFPHSIEAALSSLFSWLSSWKIMYLVVYLFTIMENTLCFKIFLIYILCYMEYTHFFSRKFCILQNAHVNISLSFLP